MERAGLRFLEVCQQGAAPDPGASCGAADETREETGAEPDRPTEASEKATPDAA